MEPFAKPAGNPKPESLPSSDDREFWGEADVHSNLTPAVHPFFTQPHFFVRVTGHEAQCTHCDWGFALDRGDKVKDGHLYNREGQLVI